MVKNVSEQPLSRFPGESGSIKANRQAKGRPTYISLPATGVYAKLGPTSVMRECWTTVVCEVTYDILKADRIRIEYKKKDIATTYKCRNQRFGAATSHEVQKLAVSVNATFNEHFTGRGSPSQSNDLGDETALSNNSILEVTKKGVFNGPCMLN